MAPRSRPFTLNMPTNAAAAITGNASVARRRAQPRTGRPESVTSRARSGRRLPATIVSRVASAAPHSAAERTMPICVAVNPSRAQYSPISTAIIPMASARRNAAV